jgi:hypothetical protein
MTQLEMEGLKLTEEEAFSLLGLCLTSPQKLDGISEAALRKLAEFCSRKVSYHSSVQPRTIRYQCELDQAGA